MGKISPSYLISEQDDLSFLLYFSKQCLGENIRRKFPKNVSATINSEELRASLQVWTFSPQAITVSVANQLSSARSLIVSSAPRAQRALCDRIQNDKGPFQQITKTRPFTEFCWKFWSEKIRNIPGLNRLVKVSLTIFIYFIFFIEYR